MASLGPRTENLIISLADQSASSIDALLPEWKIVQVLTIVVLRGEERRQFRTVPTEVPGRIGLRRCSSMIRRRFDRSNNRQCNGFKDMLKVFSLLTRRWVDCRLLQGGKQHQMLYLRANANTASGLVVAGAGHQHLQLRTVGKAQGIEEVGTSKIAA